VSLGSVPRIRIFIFCPRPEEVLTFAPVGSPRKDGNRMCVQEQETPYRWFTSSATSFNPPEGNLPEWLKYDFLPDSREP
jgi:hypothetical protein